MESTIRHRCLLALAVATVALVSASQQAEAQISGTTDLPYQQRFLNEQLRPLITPDFLEENAADRFVTDYGAIMRYTGIWLEDHGPAFTGSFQASRGVHLWEIRPWLSANLDDVHRGFVRGQYGFQQYQKGDSFIRNSEWQGPFVDIGFYQFDVDQAARRYGDAVVESWAADVTIGRQFLFLGRGLAYSLTTDAVIADAAVDDWGGLIFASKSIPHYDNIDISAPSFERSDRRFFGGQLEYQGIDHHELYAYALVQRDHSGEVLRTASLLPVQRYDYDSEYWGVGATGEFLFGPPECAEGVPNLRYFAEFVFQTGRSFANFQTDRREDIRAWAGNIGLTYYSTAPTAPRFDIEYAHASGDPDRLTPQGSLFGNEPGTNDTSFLSFGYVNTGVSFAPLLSNLQFLRVGASCWPFENNCPECYAGVLRHMEVGTNAFVYWRPQQEGGTSDIRNDIPGTSFLGTEYDLYLNWRLSSDLYLLANYGIFLPHDDSFSEANARQFVSWSLNWLL